jgi:hypothetical protein
MKGRDGYQRRLLQEAYDSVLKQVAVLVMPSTPMTAHRRRAEKMKSASNKAGRL